jgi:hypothetical protein
MSYSQFDEVAIVRRKIGTPPPGTKPGDVVVEVSGPLSLDPNVTYVMPITVVFSIIQNPLKVGSKDKIDHDPSHAARKSGCLQINDPKAKEWRTLVALDPKKFTRADARGVGVAVLEQVTQFGIETITWCDHVELPDLAEAVSAGWAFQGT